MDRNKRILAIVPARGGSKGLPGKNILICYGKPLLAWTLEAVLKSEVVDKIIVSTDSPEIANVAEKYGVPTPVLRPRFLANDTATTDEVVMYEISRLEDGGETFDIVMKLQPTSPLRQEQDIRGAVQFLLKKKAQAVVSVCAAETHPSWVNKLPPDLNMGSFTRPEIHAMNRQDLESYYRLNGAIYVSYVDHFKARRSFFSSATYAYLMPQERSVDIDTEVDFRLAEVILESWGGFNGTARAKAPSPFGR